MIKKAKTFIACVLTCCLCAVCTSVPVSAAASKPAAAITAQNTKTEIEHLGNGDYLVTTLEESSSDHALSRAAKTKNGSKKTTYHTASGKAVWTFTVTGTFSYNGSSATCIKASPSFSSTTTAWKATSSSATRSANKAIGKITAKQYRLGVCTSTVDRTVTLSCSKTGVLS